MDDTFIVTAYSIIADTMAGVGHQSHCLARVSDAEILTVAVVAAKYFHNHQERALCVMIRLGYLCPLSVSRYNRRLHALASWLEAMLVLLGELFAKGEVFICQSASAFTPGAAKRSVVKRSVATVLPSRRSSSVGACIWSVHLQASPSALHSWKRAITTLPHSTSFVTCCPKARASTATRVTIVLMTRRHC